MELNPIVKLHLEDGACGRLGDFIIGLNNKGELEVRIAKEVSTKVISVVPKTETSINVIASRIKS